MATGPVACPSGETAALDTIRKRDAREVLYNHVLVLLRFITQGHQFVILVTESFSVECPQIYQLKSTGTSLKGYLVHFYMFHLRGSPFAYQFNTEIHYHFNEFYSPQRISIVERIGLRSEVGWDCNALHTLTNVLF